MANKIKKDDEVQVLTGKDKGKKGKVLSVDIKAENLQLMVLTFLKNIGKKLIKVKEESLSFLDPLIFLMLQSSVLLKRYQPKLVSKF